MANHISAVKRIRQNKKKRVRNASQRSKVHSTERKLLSAIAEKDENTIKELLPQTTRAIMRACSKGVFHSKTASRKVSRLAKKANKVLS